MPPEVPKETEEHLKLASESAEKHIEIEHLELSDALEQTVQVPPTIHQEEPIESAESPALEEMPPIGSPPMAQSEIAADLGDLLS